MTTLWESTLRKVQEGHAPLEGFLHAVRVQLSELVARAKNDGPLSLPGAETRPCRAPGCTGSLRKRTGKKGAFWACSRYPDCRETASTESGAGGSGRRGRTRRGR
jgi:DNA topoisomerase III